MKELKNWVVCLPDRIIFVGFLNTAVPQAASLVPPPPPPRYLNFKQQQTLQQETFPLSVEQYRADSSGGKRKAVATSLQTSESGY